jgi:hypothetical protein
MCEKRASLPEGIFSCTSVRIDRIILMTYTSLISQLYKAYTNLTSGVLYVISGFCKGKGKGKGHPITGHEGPEGK